MTISTSLKYIFIHVPKTGGTPIYKHLMEYFDGKHKRVHLSAKNIQKKIGENKYNEYFKFAFVRNPFSRMVSWYHWIKQEAKIKKEIIDPGTFENFIKNYERIYSDQPASKMTYSFRENQIDFISAKSSLLPDFIGRFENLENDWKKACKKIGIRYIKLDVYKKQNYGDYHDFYTPQLIDIMRKRFYKDLDFFGYGL